MTVREDSSHWQLRTDHWQLLLLLVHQQHSARSVALLGNLMERDHDRFAARTFSVPGSQFSEINLAGN